MPETTRWRAGLADVVSGAAEAVAGAVVGAVAGAFMELAGVLAGRVSVLMAGLEGRSGIVGSYTARP
jgi:hypothetical protein